MSRSCGRVYRGVAVLCAGPSFAAHAQAGDVDLARELTNALADLMTLPMQMNFDRRIGPADGGSKITTNVQPVTPFNVTEDWNLI